MGAVFYPWIFMMVLMVQVVEYFSSTYLLAPVGWPTIMSLQNNDSVFTIMEIVALSLIFFCSIYLTLSLSGLWYSTSLIMSSRNLTQKVKYQNLNSEYIGLLTAQDLFSQRLRLLFSGDTKVHWPKLRWRLEVSYLNIKSCIWSVIWSPIFLTLRVFHWQPIKKCSIVIIVIVLNIFHEVL